MNETEAAAIEEGFKEVLISAFRWYVEATDEHSKWGDGAMERFREHVAHARAARAAALKVIEG